MNAVSSPIDPYPNVVHAPWLLPVISREIAWRRPRIVEQYHAALAAGGRAPEHVADLEADAVTGSRRLRDEHVAVGQPRSASMTVVCPTRTRSTSVIALAAPIG
jgi:hypothetical protein